MFFLLNIYISSVIRCVCALMPIEARRERVWETLEIELQAVGLGTENQTHPLEEQDKPF